MRRPATSERRRTVARAAALALVALVGLLLARGLGVFALPEERAPEAAPRRTAPPADGERSGAVPRAIAPDAPTREVEELPDSRATRRSAPTVPPVPADATLEEILAGTLGTVVVVCALPEPEAWSQRDVECDGGEGLGVVGAETLQLILFTPASGTCRLPGLGPDGADVHVRYPPAAEPGVVPCESLRLE